MANLVSDLVALVGATVGAAARRTALSVGEFAVAGLLVTTAYVALVAALAIFLGHWLGMVAALAVVAAVALVLAAVLALVAWAANRATRQQAAAEARLRRVAITAAIMRLPDRTLRHPLVILAAIGVGFGLGLMSPRRPDDES